MITLFRRFLPSILPLLLGVAAFQSVQAVLNIVLPKISAHVIDDGVLRGDTAYIWRTGGWMAAAALGQLLSALAGLYFGTKAATAFGRQVRHDLFHKVTGFSAREVGRYGASSLSTRVTNDVQQVQLALLMLCNTAVAAPVTAAFGITMAFRQDAGVTWVLVAAVAVLLTAVAALFRIAGPAFRAMQERLDGVHRVLREQVIGIRVIRAFTREPTERSRFREVNAELTDAALATGRFLAVLMPIVLLVQNLATVVVLWFGAKSVSSGDLTVGGLFAFLGYIAQVLAAVMMATFTIVQTPRAAVSGQRIIEVLDTEPSVQPPAGLVRQVPRRGLLELRGVEFGYPGAHLPVLRDISLAAAPGQRVAIVGSTGAGKTTLVNLVPRLFDATRGSVLVDGTDVRDFDPLDLRGRIGLVPQRPYLFAGTVATNLRYGKPDATESELWLALEIAQARGFVEQLPQGLDAPVSQGGANLSGGQRQRLAIARAVVRRPDIYLFDDAFSALDLATDARLRAALEPHTTEATVLIVAQRISTVVDADQILVLDDGHAVGLGTHSELLASCPTYVEIVDSQQLTEEAPA